MKDEIVLYRPNEQFQLEVQLKDETVWLTQQQIADLFGVKQPAVSKHLSNIFREGPFWNILQLMVKFIVPSFII